MALLAGMIFAVAASSFAMWAWRCQAHVLDVLGPAKLLRLLEVRITAVLVSERSVILGVRDETDQRSLHTLVVGIGAEHEVQVARVKATDDAAIRFVSAGSGSSGNGGPGIVTLATVHAPFLSASGKNNCWPSIL